MFGILRVNSSFKACLKRIKYTERTHTTKILCSKPQNPSDSLKNPTSYEVKPPSPSTSSSSNESDNSGGPKHSKGGSFGKKFIGFSLLLASGISIATYASPEFRKLLKENVPYSQETIITFVDWCDANLSPYYDSVMKQTQTTPKQLDEKKPVRIVATVNTSSSPPAASGKIDHLSSPPSQADIEAEVNRIEDLKKRKNLDLQRRLTDGVKLCNNLTTKAIKEIEILVKKIENHATSLKAAIEDDPSGDESLHNKLWSAAHDASIQKKDAKPKAESAHAAALKAINELKEEITRGFADSETKSNTALSDAQRSVTQLQYQLSEAMGNVTKAESDYKMISQYKDLVGNKRSDFLKELQSILVPEVDLSKKKTELTVEEVNSLLIHAHRYIDRLQLKLAEQESTFKKRINSALQQQQQEDDKLAKESLARELERIANESVIQRQVMESELRKEFEKDVTRALAIQATAHQDHLRQVLRQQRESLEATFDVQLRESLLKERENFEIAITTWTNRVKGIEAVVEGRAAAEHEARAAQELWLAAQSLLNATIKNAFTQMNSERRLPALQALARVVGDMAERSESKVIQELLEHIPQRALKEGVYSEDQLLQRFKKVKRICRRVAMLDESGASIPLYALSWLLSVFVFEPIRTLESDDEVVLMADSGAVNTSRVAVWGLDSQRQLDTFMLLSSAERAMQEGQLELAVRFLGQLKGMPAAVAEDWLKEARLLLETRQVARAVCAAASAQGMAGMNLPDPRESNA